MFETVEDIDITFEQDGLEVVKQLDKEVLTKGAWSTVMFKYQDWDRRKEEYSLAKFSIRRYKKLKGSYREQSKFNISSVKQAQSVTEILQKWIAEDSQQ